MSRIVLAQLDQLKVFQLYSVLVNYLFQKPAVQRKWLVVSLLPYRRDVLIIICLNLVEQLQFLEVNFCKVFHKVPHWNMWVEQLPILREYKCLHIIVELLYLHYCYPLELCLLPFLHPSICTILFLSSNTCISIQFYSNRESLFINGNSLCNISVFYKYSNSYFNNM
jgi:hypothetical protein